MITRQQSSQIAESLRGENIEQWGGDARRAGTYILPRTDTAANFTSVNPILRYGELARESDTGRTKVGDSVTAWTSLAYVDTNRTTATISTNTAAGAAAKTEYVYLVTNSSTLTLPTAVGNANSYTVQNSGVGTPVVATTGGQTILGSATATLPIANMSLTFISNGSNWVII